MLFYLRNMIPETENTVRGVKDILNLDDEELIDC